MPPRIAVGSTPCDAHLAACSPAELFIKEINDLENQILDLHDQLKLSEMKLER
jgi:hypothetical protein